MAAQAPLPQLISRAVLRPVSPMAIRVLAVPDDLDLPAFDEVFRSILDWEGMGFILGSGKTGMRPGLGTQARGELDRTVPEVSSMSTGLTTSVRHTIGVDLSFLIPEGRSYQDHSNPGVVSSTGLLENGVHSTGRL